MFSRSGVSLTITGPPITLTLALSGFISSPVGWGEQVVGCWARQPMGLAFQVTVHSWVWPSRTYFLGGEGGTELGFGAGVLGGGDDTAPFSSYSPGPCLLEMCIRHFSSDGFGLGFVSGGDALTAPFVRRSPAGMPARCVAISTGSIGTFPVGTLGSSVIFSPEVAEARPVPAAVPTETELHPAYTASAK